jgi:AraC-like DNA-binding protein
MAIKGVTRKKINALMEKMFVDDHGLQKLSLLFKIFGILSDYPEYESLASPGYIQYKQPDLNNSDRFIKVSEYIMRNFDRDIALPEIAGVANMAMTTFCNFFKKHYGLTFVEYLHDVRIGHACKLLGERNHESIIHVAYECGFNNLAHFNRQFKRIKKMTPTEYRRMVNI